MNLAAMRELVGRSQTEVAEAMGSSQSEISRSERREDHLVSTLREYIRALGGELELTARFGDRSIRLRGV
jgi:transcriptional regulator with XRE-family HTH domain